MRVQPERPTCITPGCGKPAKAYTGKKSNGGYRRQCSACLKAQETSRNREKPCDVPGCGRPRWQARRHCVTHGKRLTYFGSTLDHIPIIEQEPNTYESMHAHLKAVRGKASKYFCIRCGSQAHHWALKNEAPSVEIGSRDGRPARWSRDINAYDPMCPRCHSRMDHEYRQEIRNAS